MDNRICFPFTAAVGQNDVREALLLNLIDPSIGGVLIDGERGSGKSTLARSIAPLCAGPFVEAPLSVSEDRLCGAADLEMTMQSGRLCFDIYCHKFDAKLLEPLHLGVAKCTPAS